MKSVEQILEYISTYYTYSTERPEGFFRNLESMESELRLLEGLYEFIMDEPRQFATYSSGANQFFGDEGYGALGYSHGKVDDDQPARPPVAPPSENELARMKQFADFWRKYLSSDRRITAARDGG